MLCVLRVRNKWQTCQMCFNMRTARQSELVSASWSEDSGWCCCNFHLSICISCPHFPIGLESDRQAATFPAADLVNPARSDSSSSSSNETSSNVHNFIPMILSNAPLETICTAAAGASSGGARRDSVGPRGIIISEQPLISKKCQWKCETNIPP